jgi:myo-inositol-1(or 4)-monophosphatase
MSNFVETAAAIAREADAIIRDFRRQGIGFELKGEADLVTLADRASELHITSRLRAAYPDHSIVAEEGNNTTGSTGYCWYVDPLDGTTNFAHGYPVYNTTLALEKDGELIAGVIYDGTRDEMFTAERGAGAFLNGQPIRVSQAKTIEDALFCTGFPSKRRHLNINIHFYYQLAMITHGVRRAGAAAIDLAYVACGRLDGFWEFQLSPWDMAAGKLLIEEAGGKVTDMHGRPHTLKSYSLLSTNSLIHPSTLDLFEKVFAGQAPYALPEVNTYMRD